MYTIINSVTQKLLILEKHIDNAGVHLLNINLHVEWHISLVEFQGFWAS